MLETFGTVFSTMMGLLLCLAIGYILRCFHLEPGNTPTVLSKLEIYVFMPAMVLSSFIKSCTVQSLRDNAQLFVYGLVCAAVTFVLGKVLGRFFSKDRYERKIYAYSLSVANFGYIGMPLAASLFGSQGLFEFNIFAISLNMLTYGYLVPSLVPEGKENPKGGWLRRLMSPITVAMLLGIILGLTGLSNHLPGFVRNTVDNLSGCLGPVAMILTGFVVGGFHLPDLLKIKKVYLVSFLRLLVLPLVFAGLVWLMGGDKNACLLTMISFASALGLNTVVIPASYGGDVHTGASMALISSVGCVATLPLLYAFLNMIL